MKAIILAAGKGTRLGKLTQNTPKCLLPVGNKSMLEHWFSILNRHNINEVLINTHHLADKVVSHCAKSISTGIKITFSYEKELLGTAKTINTNRNFVKDDRHFLIVYADTWMNIDLHKMLKVQKRHQGIGTIGLYRPEDLKDQGVVKVEGRKITDIEEKSKSPKGKHAFAGIMIGIQTMFRFYNDSMTDLVRDWLPVIKDGLNPFFIDEMVYDIGTSERYKLANEKIKSLGLKAL